MKRLLLTALSLGVCLIGYAQVNTPAGATWPFGSRIQQFALPYPYGIIPTNLPTGTYNPATNQFGKSQHAYDAYVQWKACYAFNCGGGQWRIRFDNPSQTVSEGIGYGMLLAAYAADKQLFDGLLAYYKARTNGNGFMNWHVNDGGASSCGSTYIGTNGALDSEVDVAMALIIAECQWPSINSPYDYDWEAGNLIGRIRQFEISTSCGSGNMQFSNGDGWTSGCSTCRNPSYQAPAYGKFYQTYDDVYGGGAPAGFWNTVTNNAYTQILVPNRNATTGLVSNWSSTNGTANTCASPAFLDHGYDAIRNPWRMATDYIWWGDTRARDNFTQPITNWIRTKTATLTNPGALRGPVDQNGNNNGRTLAGEDAIFTSMWGAATIGIDATANNQATANFMYDRVRNVVNPQNGCTNNPNGYFGNTLRVISLFMLTGNFWKPCEQPCAGPSFAVDSVSVCGGASVVLDGGIAAGSGKSFQWFKVPSSTAIPGATGPTLTVSASTPASPNTPPGWFKIRLNDNGCIRTDSIYVSLNSVLPALGQNIQLCDPSEVTLNANVLGSGYSFIWEYASSGNYGDLAVIPGQTNSTLTKVRRPGLYKVSSIKGGCVTKWDTIRVTSLVASPQDACFTGTPPGSVTLSVIGPNLGAASNYDWYNVPTGGSVLSGGSGTYTYNTPSLAAGTYTYYIQDKSRVYAKVGKTAPTSPPASNCGGQGPAPNVTNPWYGIDDDNVYLQTWVVSKNINIDSVTVYFCLYNNTDLQSVQFVLTNDIGTTALQTTPARPVVRYVGAPASFGPPYDGRVVGVRFYVGINNVNPGTYKLKAINTVYSPANAFANMLLEQHPTNISYAYKDNLDENTVSIINSYSITYSNTTYLNRYAHFYDWAISTVNSCDRIPVYAYIGSSNCPVELPVELTDFSGRYEGGKVFLNWKTASEKEASHFIVERSNDGENFVSIGKVTATGNSSLVTTYNFIDTQPLNGVSYYRLINVDKDGSGKTSKVIFIEKYSPSLEVYPNPSSNEITVALKGWEEKITCLNITDILGKVIYSVNDEFSIKTINVADLPEGTYIISACYSGGYHAVRFVKKGE